MSAKEKILDILTLNGETLGKDTFQASCEVVEEIPSAYF